MLRDAPAPCPRAAEYDWLDRLRLQLEAIKAELLAGYPRPLIPDAIDAAHGFGEDMSDAIYERMLKIDAGED
jgi:hypothetical protein